MRKRYNTPHRSRVVKTRMTEEEYAEFAERLSAYNMSQAEFIRQAITGAAIRPIITVSPVNDELLAAVGKLTAEYGRIGGNLNQIARTLNEWHSPYPQLAGEVATERDRICVLYAAHGAAAGKSAILPVPEIVSVPSVSNVQVRLSPQDPSTAAAEAGGTHRHSSRKMQSTAASTRFIILAPFARRDAPRQNSALIIT